MRPFLRTFQKAAICLGILAGFCSIYYLIVKNDSKPTASDLIVVLAGSYAERSTAAAELYRKGYARRILLTDDGVRMGWSHQHQRSLSAIERAEDLLLRRGVPQDVIIKLPFYRSGTVYDALAVKRYLHTNHFQSILLVTSNYHASRAQWVFRQVLRNQPISIAIAPVPSDWSSTRSIMVEPLKTAYYRIRFGLFNSLPKP